MCSDFATYVREVTVRHVPSHVPGFMSPATTYPQRQSISFPLEYCFFLLENWREKLMVVFDRILTTQIYVIFDGIFHSVIGRFRWNLEGFDKKYHFLSRMVSIDQSISTKFFISLINCFQGSLVSWLGFTKNVLFFGREYLFIK